MIPSASDWQISQASFYLALCYFLRVGVCDSPRYPSDLSLFQSLYKYLSLCSQDRSQEWCLVCLIFPRCFCGYIAPPLPDFFQDKLSCPSVAVNIFYYSYITLKFLIFRHNLVHAFAWVYANEHRWQLFLQNLGSFELSLISLTNSMQTLINICTAHSFWIIFWNVHVGKWKY